MARGKLRNKNNSIKQKVKSMKPSQFVVSGFVVLGIFGALVGGIYYSNVSYWNRLELQKQNELEELKLERYNVQYTNYNSLKAVAEQYENTVIANIVGIEVAPFIEQYDSSQVVKKHGKYGDNKTFADKLGLDYERSKGLISLIEKKETITYDYRVTDLFAGYKVTIDYGYNDADMTLSQTIKVISDEIGFVKRVTVVYDKDGNFKDYIVH